METQTSEDKNQQDESQNIQDPSSQEIQVENSKNLEKQEEKNIEKQEIQQENQQNIEKLENKLIEKDENIQQNPEDSTKQQQEQFQIQSQIQQNTENGQNQVIEQKQIENSAQNIENIQEKQENSIENNANSQQQQILNENSSQPEQQNGNGQQMQQKSDKDEEKKDQIQANKPKQYTDNILEQAEKIEESQNNTQNPQTVTPEIIPQKIQEQPLPTFSIPKSNKRKPWEKSKPKKEDNSDKYIKQNTSENSTANTENKPQEQQQKQEQQQQQQQENKATTEQENGEIIQQDSTNKEKENSDQKDSEKQPEKPIKKGTLKDLAASKKYSIDIDSWKQTNPYLSTTPAAPPAQQQQQNKIEIIAPTNGVQNNNNTQSNVESQQNYINELENSFKNNPFQKLQDQSQNNVNGTNQNQNNATNYSATSGLSYNELQEQLEKYNMVILKQQQIIDRLITKVDNQPQNQSTLQSQFNSSINNNKNSSIATNNNFSGIQTPIVANNNTSTITNTQNNVGISQHKSVSTPEISIRKPKPWEKKKEDKKQPEPIKESDKKDEEDGDENVTLGGGKEKSQSKKNSEDQIATQGQKKQVTDHNDVISQFIQKQEKQQSEKKNSKNDAENMDVISDNDSDNQPKVKQNLQKKLEPKQFVKAVRNIEGVCILELHQLKYRGALKRIINKKNMVSIIRNSLIKLQKQVESGDFSPEVLSNKENFPQNNFNNFTIYEVSKFLKFNFLTTEYPYLVSFTVQLSYKVPENTENKSLFTDYEETRKIQVQMLKQNDVNITLQFWNEKQPPKIEDIEKSRLMKSGILGNQGLVIDKEYIDNYLIKLDKQIFFEEEIKLPQSQPAKENEKKQESANKEEENNNEQEKQEEKEEKEEKQDEQNEKKEEIIVSPPDIIKQQSIKDEIYFDQLKQKLYYAKSYQFEQIIQNQQEYEIFRQCLEHLQFPENSKQLTEQYVDSNLQKSIDILLNSQYKDDESSEQSIKLNPQLLTLIQQIQVLYQLFNKENQVQHKKSLNLFQQLYGVLFEFKKEQEKIEESKFVQESIYLNNYEKIDRIVILQEYFGCCEYRNKDKKFTFNIMDYMKYNKTNFINKGLQSRVKEQFLKEIYRQVILGLDFLKQQNIGIKNFTDKDILIRRKFIQDKTHVSNFEIKIAPQFEIYDYKQAEVNSQNILSRNNLFNSENGAQNLQKISQSVDIENISQLYSRFPCQFIKQKKQHEQIYKHPRYYFKDYPADYDKDLVYAMGILMLQFQQDLEFQKDDYIAQENQNLIKKLTGFECEQIETYFKKLRIGKINEAKKAFSQKFSRSSQIKPFWKKIPDLSDLAKEIYEEIKSEREQEINSQVYLENIHKKDKITRYRELNPTLIEEKIVVEEPEPEKKEEEEQQQQQDQQNQQNQQFDNMQNQFQQNQFGGGYNGYNGMNNQYNSFNNNQFGNNYNNNFQTSSFNQQQQQQNQNSNNNNMNNNNSNNNNNNNSNMNMNNNNNTISNNNNTNSNNNNNMGNNMNNNNNNNNNLNANMNNNNNTSNMGNNQQNNNNNNNNQ